MKVLKLRLVASAMTALSALALALLVIGTTLTDTARAAPLKPRLDGMRHFFTALSKTVVGQRLGERLQSGQRSELTCDVCKIVTGILDVLFLQNATDKDIVDVATALCIDFDIEDRNVCTLVIKEFEVSRRVYKIECIYTNWF